MLETLTMVLIAFGLGLFALTALVLLLSFLVACIAYRIWKGQPAPTPPIPRPRPRPKEPNEDDDVPEGFQGHYRWWTDPISGVKKLLPAEDVEALYKAAAEQEREAEEQQIEDWIEGRNGSESKPRNR